MGGAGASAIPAPRKSRRPARRGPRSAVSVRGSSCCAVPFVAVSLFGLRTTPCPPDGMHSLNGAKGAQARGHHGYAQP